MIQNINLKNLFNDDSNKINFEYCYPKIKNCFSTNTSFEIIFDKIDVIKIEKNNNTYNDIYLFKIDSKDNKPIKIIEKVLIKPLIVIL